MENKLDIMAFGAHPDDIEIGMGATIAKHARQGFKVGMVDLTDGEMSTNGTPDIREMESLAAKDALGAHFRINLGLKDRNIDINIDARRKVVELIRCYRPRLVFIPSGSDRHPDHGACSELIYHSIFDSTLCKFSSDQPVHRVHSIYYYFINDRHATPSVIIDVSSDYTKKTAALSCHSSQFGKDLQSQDTPLNSGYVKQVEIRDRYFGQQIGKEFGEGFSSNDPIGLHDFFSGGLLL